VPSIAFAKGHGLGNDYIVMGRADLPFDLSGSLHRPHL
jgi:diaminopimelate epimerase